MSWREGKEEEDGGWIHVIREMVKRVDENDDGKNWNGESLCGTGFVLSCISRLFTFGQVYLERFFGKKKVGEEQNERKKEIERGPETSYMCL